VDTNGEDVQTFADSNDIKNSGYFDGYALLYIHLINKGSATKERCLNFVTERVTKRKYINQEMIFLLTDQNPVSDLGYNEREFDTYLNLSIRDNNYYEISTTLNGLTVGKHLIVKESETKKEHLKHEDWTDYSKDLDLSIFLNPTVLLGDQFYLDRGAITSYGFKISKTFKSQHALGLALGASFKRPNENDTRSTIQANARSAVLSNEDTLFINENLKGHVLYSLELDYRYYTSHSKRTRWFFGAGLGVIGTKSVKGKIEESVDLSEVDIYDPSSYQDIADGDDFEPELVEKNQQLYYGLVEFGFQQRISPVVKLGLSIPLKFYYNEPLNFSGTSSIGINFNLAFKINGGKNE